MGLKALCGSESNTHIQLYCDNTSSCAYLRNFGGKKRYLNVLAIDIWNWCISRSIHLSMCVGLANPTLTFLPLGSIINLKNTFHLDQILMQWWWMLFQYLGLNNNMSIFLHLSAPSVWFYGRLFVCLFVCFTSQVNSYGHCGTVSSPNHSFSWAGLNKRLTSNSCTYFRL